MRFRIISSFRYGITIHLLVLLEFLEYWFHLHFHNFYSYPFPISLFWWTCFWAEEWYTMLMSILSQIRQQANLLATTSWIYEVLPNIFLLIVKLHAQSISWFHYDVIWCNPFREKIQLENESVTWIIKHINFVSIHYVRIFDNVNKRTKPSVMLYLIKYFIRVVFYFENLKIKLLLIVKCISCSITTLLLHYIKL